METQCGWQFVQQYRPKLLAMARKYATTINSPEDIVSIVTIQAPRIAHHYDSRFGQSFVTYMLCTLERRMLSVTRKKTREVNETALAAGTERKLEAWGSDDQARTVETRELLERVALLDDAERLFVEAMYVDGLTKNLIAQKYRVSPWYVSKKIENALRILAAEMR